MNQFEIVAEHRAGTGRTAARRLRQTGQIPGIIYGGKQAPESIAVSVRALTKQLENDAFFSHILTVKVDGRESQVVLKALQRHPVSARVIHLDLQRISQAEALHMHVPLHFLNEDTSPGKKAGGLFTHHMIEVEVSCLPKDLPEFIAVDVAALEMGGIVHLRELLLPEGVTLVTHGGDLETPVVSIQHAQKLDVEPGEDEGGAAPGSTV